LTSSTLPVSTCTPPEPEAAAAAAAAVIHRPSRTVERVSPGIYVMNLIAVVLPLAGLAAAIVLLWGRGFSWIYLGLMAGMFVLTGLGITVGYHRLFTHRAFDAHGAVKAALVIFGSMAVQGPLIKWVAVHRRHHQHSDEHDDPHSPRLHGDSPWGMIRGLCHAHIGWFFEADIPGIRRYAADLERDTLLRRVSALFPLWAALGLLLPAALGGLITMTWTGVLLGFLWGGLARLCLVHHVTWSINSVCHLWGTRPYRSHDHSRNNVVFGILGLGEGWHNNHHAFPTSARHGLRWWQLDGSYWLIRSLESLGLAWNVRVPDAADLASKRHDGGEN
jgi:stearoyl-CoA desaturase (delta-9 desaturase)